MPFLFAILAIALVLSACASATPEIAEVIEEPVQIDEPVVEPTEEPAPTEEPEPDWESPEGALVSIAVETAPELDGAADDLWADAPAIQVEVEGGANMGETVVSIQSVYKDDMVYFYVTWEDPTQSFFRSPWEKQEDGTWMKITDPDDRGGDNNVYYEDKLSFIWTIDNSIPKFESQGCGPACHAGEDSDDKPYGNKYTDEEGQYGDIWHWKSVRNLGQVDDQYLDWTRFSPDTRGAGRHGDPKDAGGYVNNENEDKTAPAWMGPEGFPTDGSPGFLLESEIVEFDDSQFIPGDIVPGIYKAPFEGDRGDISAGWVYVDGMWVLEIGRALETGSEFDVQFNDMAAEYYFGVAIFDNAQVRHAYQFGVNTLVFKP